MNNDKEENIIKSIKNKVNIINTNVKKLSKNSFDKYDVKSINMKIQTINKTTESSIPIVKNIHVNKDKLFEKRGILDPEGKEDNPLTKKPYTNVMLDVKGEQKYSGKTYFEIANGDGTPDNKGWVGLPMYEQKEDVINALYDKQCILITSGTGSGKTVLVPKYLLHVLNYEGVIAVTIPRIEPTLKAADFAAAALDVKLGEEVGYLTRNDKKKSAKSKLIFATDGSILSKLRRDDPNLDEYDGLIIDEAHERNANIDQMLLLLKKVLKNRPTFKLVIMSATIDPSMFLNYYKEFGMVHIEGKVGSYKNVEEIFLPDGKEVNKFAPNGELIQSRPAGYIVKTVDIIINEIFKKDKKGDILVLFPGKGDCDDACRMLNDLVNKEKKKNVNFTEKPFCIKLSAPSSKDNKNYAIGVKKYTNLNKTYTRRIVMATDIAESSITFSGDAIDFVIDTGLGKDKIYYPDREMDALETRYIAKANHIQRKGRTGRLREGTCYNIFTKKEYEKMLTYPIPPIMQEDFTETVLNFLTQPFISHIDMPFKYETISKNNNKIESESLNIFLSRLISSPPLEYINNSIKKLMLVGALSVTDKKAYLTEFGKAMSFFNELNINQAASIIHSYNYKCSAEVIDTMALLNVLENDFGKIINEPKIKKNSPDEAQKKADFKNKLNKLASSYGDHISLHNIIQTYKEKKYDIMWEHGKQDLITKSNFEKANQWAKEHYINAKKINDAIKLSKDLNNSIGRVIGLYRRNHPEKIDDRFIFVDNAPVLHDRQDDNIMESITLGHIGNIVKKSGKQYATCFPDVSSRSNIDNKSLFNYIKIQPMYCLYERHFNNNGRKIFQTFSKIPVKVIDNLSKENQDIIKSCGSKSSNNNFYRNVKIKHKKSY